VDMGESLALMPLGDRYTTCRRGGYYVPPPILFCSLYWPIFALEHPFGDRGILGYYPQERQASTGKITVKVSLLSYCSNASKKLIHQLRASLWAVLQPCVHNSASCDIATLLWAKKQSLAYQSMGIAKTACSSWG
jgi:hypothetical protein